MRRLTDREIIAKLKVMQYEQPQIHDRLETLIAKVKTGVYISADDARSIGLQPRLYTNNGNRGFYPMRGDTCIIVHPLSYDI